MAFDRKLLNTDEEILLDLRPHWWYITPQVAIVVAVVVALGLVVSFGLPQALVLVAGVVLVAALLNLVWRWITWSGINFVITTDRLIFRTGVFSKHGIEIPLERINTVFFSQTLLERLVASGDLSVESAGEGGHQDFANVRRPSLVQQEIYRAMEINKNQEFTAMAEAHAVAAGHAAASGQSMLSIPEQIEQLDQLRLRGVITEAEFQTKKTELLGRM